MINSDVVATRYDSFVNSLLIALCVVIVIVTSFFLFFWNRLLGWLFGFIFRTLLWKSNNIWIDMDAIQFSLLAGRIMIKDLRYYSINQSIRIIKFHITWRYWFWRSRVDSDSVHIEMPGEVVEGKTSDLPCRLQVVAEGVEWFIYNRTPAYDDILRHMQFDSPEDQSGHPEPSESIPFSNEAETSAPPEDSMGNAKVREAKRHLLLPVTLLKRLAEWMYQQLPSPALKEILPIGFEVTRGAITLGNDSTPNILIGNFKRATGTFGLQPSRSKLDSYKQVYNLRFKEVKVYTRVNRDHDRPMRERGQMILEEIRRLSFISTSATPSPENFLFKAFHLIAPRLFRTPRPADPSLSGKKWAGLSRYYTQNEKNDDSNAHEYAKLSTLLETPILDLTYYADVAGLVPSDPVRVGRSGLEAIDVGNGDLAPEWGIDFVIHGGQANYGPWMDRQRRSLQEVFFPATFYPRRPTETLHPGQSRLHVALKIFVEIRDGLKLRMPTRELSKNWRYDAAGDLGPARLASRPFGWFDVVIGAHSNVTYDMAMVAHDRGYYNMLQVHLDTVSMSSSVNQSRFLYADSCRVVCEMPSPLQWNEHREWQFHVSFTRPVIYLLRDHVTLITDLSKDWTRGPPVEYARFVPITYCLRLAFKDVHLGVYLNDHNVIDYPLVDPQNTLLWFTSPVLSTEVRIPSMKYRPMSSTVQFSLEAAPLDISLTLPNWNTNALLATNATQSVGQVGSLMVRGSFMYFADVVPGNVDVLKIDINSRNLLLKAHGRTVHHLIRLRENYFGNFTNFSTRSEYLDKRSRGMVGDPMVLKYRKGKSNMFQVSIRMDIQDFALLLPRELHDFRSATLVYIPQFQIAINLHDHFMDLAVNAGLLRVSDIEDCSNVDKVADLTPTRYQGVLISDLELCGNRLFGPPPQNSTYLAVYEVNLGQLSGSASTDLINSVVVSAATFKTGFENALDSIAEEYRLVFEPDVTFVKIRVKSVDLTWRIPGSAILLSIPSGIRYDSNDFAGKTYKQLKSVVVPSVNVRCLSQTPNNARLLDEWSEIASASFDIHADIYGAPPNWKADAQRQRMFVQSQDAFTGRAPWIYESSSSQTSDFLRDHSLLLPAVVMPKLSQGVGREWSATDGSSTASFATASSSDLTSQSDSDDGTGIQLSFNAGQRRVSQFFADPLAGNDEELSSGDESDDGDDTSVPSSSDVESILPMVSGLTAYRGALSTYRSLSAGNRAGSTFSAQFTHHVSPVLNIHSESDSDPVDGAPAPTPQGVNDSDDITIIRVQSKRTAELLLTPMAATVLQTIIEEQHSQSTPPGFELDKMFRKFVSLPPPASHSPKQLFFHGRLYRATLTVLQIIELESDLDATLFDGPRNSSLPPLGLLTATLFEGRCNGAVGDTVTSVSASYSNAILDLRIGRAPLHSSALSVSSGQLTARSSSIAVKRNCNGLSIDPVIGEVHIDLPHWAPSLLYQFSNAFAAAFTPMAAQQRELQELKVRYRRELFHALLKAACHESVAADPLSRTQVSFMVNSGNPKTLRADPSLAILAHMRTAVRRVGHVDISQARSPAGHTSEDIAAEEFRTLLTQMSRRSLVDLHPDDTSDTFVYRRLFPSKSRGQRRSLPLPLALRLSCQRVLLQLGGTVDTRNKLELGPGNLRIQFSERIFAMSPPLEANKSSASISSLVPDQPVLHAVVTGSLALFTATLHPSLLSVIEGILRLKREPSTQPMHASPAPRTPVDVQDRVSRPKMLYVEIFADVEQFELRALAQLLTVGIKLTGGHLSICSLGARGVSSWIRKKPSVSLLGGFRELSVQARSTQDEADLSHADRAVLASSTLHDGELFSTTDMECVRGTFTLNTLKLTVPRSALKLYTFVKQWEAAYLPSYDATFRKMFSKRSAKASPRPSSVTSWSIDLQIQIHHFGVYLHVMHGTWLSWTLEDTLAYSAARDLQAISYGVRLASQRIILSAEPDDTEALPSSTHAVKLALPSLRLQGVIQSDHIQASLVIDHFRLMLKPQYVDDILVVQQKFGSDFNELVDMFAGSRPKMPQNSHSSSFEFDAAVKLESFRIGIEGPTSTQYLQSPMVSASYRSIPPSGSRWHLDVKKLELSLVHNVHPLPSKRYREEYKSASMSLDCVVHNQLPLEAHDNTEYLTLNVSRVHALMAPAAIGEFGNLIDHVQAEMLQRKRDRALELEEIRSKTRHVIKTFEGPTVLEPPHSPFRNRVMTLAVERIGIAFPLMVQAGDGSTSTAPFRRHDVEPVPAFLFSIASLRFATQREESGNARISNFAFQFVPAFDQRRQEHFSSASHPRSNRMLYPEMSADIRSDTSATSRQVMIRAAVSGFELDISPSLPGYIFALIDVYRDGKEEIERFLPSGPGDQAPAESESQSYGISPDFSAIPTSEITTSLEFQSGRVQFHMSDSIDETRYPTTASLDPTFPDPLPSAIYSDVFRLPNVSVWLQYHATPALHKVSRTSTDAPASRLTFNAIIHSSQNTIRPSLLPFVAEVTRHVEARLADDSASSRSPHRPPTTTTPLPVMGRESPPAPMGSLEMIFTLRIDQSHLDFTCLPDVNVNAGLHWKSGGFVMRVTPGAEEISAVGSIEGISMSLRHGYLVDDCVNASARGLAFAVTYSQLSEDGRIINAVSAVIDTEIIGSVRFGRLQDILCFKAVWLDRIPVFEGTKSTPPSSPILAPVAGQARRAFITSVLVQVESLQLDVDLGQAITKLNLDLRPIMLRSRLTDEFVEISVISQLVKLDAVRAISGRIALPNVSFETIRRRRSGKGIQRTLLELSIKTGHLAASINYEGKRILLFNSDPLETTVRDEWDSVVPTSERSVNLDFSVTGGNLRVAARVMSASGLILLSGRLRSLIQTQREGAARESKVFAATRTPKPQNPLSHVALAMLQSARSKLKESEHPDILVVQHMHLDVSQIRLGIFNETDTRMTQFEADGVQGELIRHVQFEQKSPRRELTLALQSFEVRNGDVPSQDKWLEFMTGAKVFTMPEMVIEMQSTEYTEANRVEYDFKSTFPRPKARVGQRTLYIALDFHKYEQLMATQSAFKAAIERALKEIGKTQRSIPEKHTTDLPAAPGGIRGGTPAAEAAVMEANEAKEAGAKAQGTEVAEAKPYTTDISEGVETDVSRAPDVSTLRTGTRGLMYHCLSRNIETPKLHQLGAASPDLETFKQWTNISIRDSLPVWVHEYATVPIEQIMHTLLEIYIKQLKPQSEDGLEDV